MTLSILGGAVMQSVTYAKCHKKTFMLIVIMLNVAYSECHIKALSAECLYAECHYAEWRYAECRYVGCRGARKECNYYEILLFQPLSAVKVSDSCKRSSLLKLCIKMHNA
jgi:hypothetical protein